MRPDPVLLDDLVDFASWQCISGDIDPVYPTVRKLLDEWALDPTDELRFLVFYEAWYSLPSAVTAWLEMGGWHGQRVPERLALLPTGIERRGLRGGGITEHLVNAWEVVPLLTPEYGWGVLRGSVERIHGNGRWASYKLAELCQRVLGWPLVPPDAGHADSTGPRQGLELLMGETFLGNSARVIETLDAATEWITEALRPAGVRDVAETETMLCDFHALVDGRYYVGHDWDVMLHHTPVEGPTSELILRSRAAATEARWLGEHSGWTGVRRELRPLYRDQGRLDWW